MGCGRHDYDNIKKAKLKISDNQYADAVAEWPDGESLSAHYTYCGQASEVHGGWSERIARRDRLLWGDLTKRNAPELDYSSFTGRLVSFVAEV